MCSLHTPHRQTALAHAVASSSDANRSDNASQRFAPQQPGATPSASTGTPAQHPHPPWLRLHAKRSEHGSWAGQPGRAAAGRALPSKGWCISSVASSVADITYGVAFTKALPNGSIPKSSCC